MTTMIKVRCLLVFCLLSAMFAFAVQPAPKQQETYAPYWTSEPGWVTELQLKNNLLKAPLTVTTVLRLASGKEIALDATTIAPNASVSVWVNEGLMAHASDLLSQPGSYGSVVFRYTSPSAGNLYANVLLSIHGEPISFPMLARAGWSDAGSLPRKVPSSLEGIWWQPRSGLNDVLVMSNSSDAKIAGTLVLFDASGKQWTQTMVLGPRQTHRVSTSDLISKAGLSGTYGGISFVPQSPTDAVDAVHFLYDEVSKFSTSLELSSRYPGMSLRERAGPDAKHWTMYAPMLALENPDPALGLPRGVVLQPTLFIRNTAAKNITADLSLTWRGESGKGQVKLPQLKLAPFATQQMQIGSMQALLQIPNKTHWGMVTLTTDALPDDLVAFATSIDAGGRYNLATRFAGGIGGHFAGGEWDIDANHNEIAAVTNIGSRPTNALLTLHYNSGQKSYELQQTIAPGDQMWVNLAQLVRDRVADHHGNTLPPDVGAVTYDVKDLTPGAHGIMVNSLSTDTTYGFQAHRPFPRCCYNGSVGFDPGLLNLFFGTDPLLIDGIDACSGDPVDLNSDFTTWGSDNPAIAKVTPGQVQALADGTTTGFANGVVLVDGCISEPVQEYVPISVGIAITSIDPTDGIMIGSTDQTITINGYGFGGSPAVTLPPGFSKTGQSSTDAKIILTGVSISYSATVGNNTISVTGPTGSASGALAVDGPYHMIVQSDTTGLCSGCKTTVQRTIWYQIQNFGGSNAGAATWMGENASLGNSSCTPNTLPSPTACAENFYSLSNGTFADSWSMKSDSYTPVGCGFTITDHWQWCAHSPAQTLGTLTGYTHTNAILINGVLSPNQMITGTVVPF